MICFYNELLHSDMGCQNPAREPIPETGMGITLELGFNCILQLAYTSIFKYNLPLCKIFCTIPLDQKSGVTLAMFKSVNFLLNSALFTCEITKKSLVSEHWLLTNPVNRDGFTRGISRREVISRHKINVHPV